MKVFILGTGTMGTGISQLMISNPCVSKLYIYSNELDKIKKLLAECNRNLTKLFEKGKIHADIIEFGMQKVEATTELSKLIEADLIIEAVTENYEVKSTLITQVAKLIPDNTIFATNTSSLSITALGALLPKPENMIGLHFFNPAPLMELVEVVQGYVTSEEIISKILSFVKSLGKSPIVVKDSPGFVVNRMLIPMINEAICILAENVATAEDIDKSMKLGARHPMGPLMLSDLIGNDVVLSIMDILYRETGDSKYRANSLLRKMVRANHLGRKSSIGFFKY